ncbi:MAG: O-sialoglycoprotein endopeptidase [Clostridiales bacterium]|nr:O-sialoglycoprotein endopeptidase [Clostridiales bacterium]
MCSYYLGIDTSNYKTSIAIVDELGNISFNKSEFLEVEHGKRGLRQSEAFFKQSNALPQFVNDAMSRVDPKEIKAVGVSSRPRRIEGSYMPVFLAGENAAKIISSTLEIPMYEFSHQEGHIEAVLSSSKPTNEGIIFFHLSGGTTEILKVHRNSNYGFDCEIIGGTKDISIGQLLDRIGVAIGMNFPAGPELDRIASLNPITLLPRKIKLSDGYFNLSGIETDMMRKILNFDDAHKWIPGLFQTLSELLYEVSKDLATQYNLNSIYLCGGVSASDTIRSNIGELKEKDDNSNNLKFIFGEPSLSGDNAVGIARLAAIRNDA